MKQEEKKAPNPLIPNKPEIKNPSEREQKEVNKEQQELEKGQQKPPVPQPDIPQIPPYTPEIKPNTPPGPEIAPVKPVPNTTR